MQRRKFIAGLGSLAAAGAAGIGTGAFTSVSANRDAALAIASDDNAYLQLSPNSHYFKESSDGQLVLDMTGDNSTSDGGNGLNGTADTVIENAFSIKNQGTNTVYVWVATYDYDSPGNESFELVAKNQDLTFPDSASKDNQTSQVTSDENTYPGGFIQLDTGDSVDVDAIFHISGGSGREWEGKTWQFNADVDAPSGTSAWTEDTLPSHSDAQVNETDDQDGV